MLEETYENLSIKLYTLLHMKMQVGMFFLSGLTPDKIKNLEHFFHIYMTLDGRIRPTLLEIL